MRYTAARVADKYAVLVNGNLVDEFDSMDKAIARRDEIAAGAPYAIAFGLPKDVLPPESEPKPETPATVLIDKTPEVQESSVDKTENLQGQAEETPKPKKARKAKAVKS